MVDLEIVQRVDAAPRASAALAVNNLDEISLGQPLRDAGGTCASVVILSASAEGMICVVTALLGSAHLAAVLGRQIPLFRLHASAIVALAADESIHLFTA